MTPSTKAQWRAVCRARVGRLTVSQRRVASQKLAARLRRLPVYRTARWIMDHPEKARDIISNRLKYTPEVARLIHPQSFKWSRNAVHAMPSIRWWGQQMQSLKLIQQQPNYEQYFVTTFIDAALKESPRVPDPDWEKTMTIPLPQS